MEMCFSSVSVYAEVIAVLLNGPIKKYLHYSPSSCDSFSASTALKELQSYDNVLLSFCFHPCNYMSHHCAHIFSVKTTLVALTA